MSYSIKPLNLETWNDFEAIAELHNGVWGGCWCTWFHKSSEIKRGSAEENRALKKMLVSQGKSHAALVYDENKVVGWCQYGKPEELPAIYHRKEVETVDYILPDWRITCIFVDKNNRKKGIAKIALMGALELIEKDGGGTVESYPQDTDGLKVSSSFLYNGTKTLFEECGFSFYKSKGKNHTIMRINI